jgi:hypothetical protein
MIILDNKPIETSVINPIAKLFFFFFNGNDNLSSIIV